MADFYTLKVNYLKKSTANSVVIGFDIPSDVKNKFSFEAGQYISLEKKNKWKFNKKILFYL